MIFSVNSDLRAIRAVSVALLVALTAFGGLASGATWTGAGDGVDWHDANNWDTMAVPGSSQEALLSPPPEFGPIIWDTVEISTIHGPKWSSDSNQILDIVGGSLTVNNEWRFVNGGSGMGIVNISGNPSIVINGPWSASNTSSDYVIININGGTISCDRFKIGDDGGGELNIDAGIINVTNNVDFTARSGQAIALNMTGGELNIGGAFQAPGDTGGSGAVTISLDGGTIRCGSFTHAGVAYSIDITDGRLIIAGNVTSEIIADVNNGCITAFGGTADVIVEYDSSEDETIVSAVPGVTFETAASAGTEGNSPMFIPVKLNNPPPGQTVYVDYLVTGGTAQGDGVDYTLESGTLTFNPGEITQYIEVNIVNDGPGEEDETIEIGLFNPVNIGYGAIIDHTYTILDLSPWVQFDAVAAYGRENLSPVQIPVNLSWVWNDTVTIDYAVTGGSAQGGGIDYTLAAGTLEFEAGIVTEYIGVELVDDLFHEDPDETIEVTLSNPTNAKVGDDDVHTFTILPPAVLLCPKGDLDGDCCVDWFDLRVFAGQWLDSPGSCDGFDCADLDQINGVDMVDYAALASNWQQKVYPIVINEFMASNALFLEDTDDPCDFPDWIELYNSSPISVDLGGMYITDKLDDPTKWQIPSGVTIDGGAYLILWADRQPFQGPTHVDFKLSASGEAIGLFDTDGVTLIDSIVFGEQITDISYGVYPDASENPRFFAVPSPWAENDGAYDGEVADTQFSHDRGFYDAPFDLSITSETSGAQIHYTLNGSEPNEFVGGDTYLYSGPFEVNETTTLRAAAFKPGYLPTNVDTQTYIFLDDVLTQPDMNSVVVVANESTIRDGMQLIPTLSLAMSEDDFANLQLQDSRYPLEGTAKEELSVSIELIYADANDGEGMQINCGIEGHSWAKPKRSFRLMFKSEFGPSKLEYPFFESAPLNGDSVTSEFDRIVLRAAKNAPVVYPGDQWTRDSQILMSGNGAHGTFVQLYVNGKYRGVYNATERPDARFSASYYGGDEQDYFATNHGIERCCGTYCPIIIDSPCHLSGDDTRFNQMMNMAYDRDLEDANEYQQFQRLCDIREFADYTIIFWFSGFGDSMNNNWYAGMRNSPLEGSVPPEGLRMYMWDAEYVFVDSVGPLASSIPWAPPYYFNAGWMISDIWRALMENQDFRVLFADRVYQHCFNDGPLADDNAQARWDTIVDYLDETTFCEAARWPEDLAYDAVDMNGFVNVFINALRTWSNPGWPNVKLYPDLDPPTFNQHGGQVASGFGVTLTNPNGSGTIYYTLDGTDPRQAVTGTPVGTPYGGAITLNQSAHIKARVFDDPNWSAVNEVTFVVGPVAQNLRITEIMYNPPDTNDPNDPNTEYIELKNLGPETINLDLVEFTNGIDFTFPSITLTSGQHVLVVKDQNAFEAKYGTGRNVAGQYVGSLNNGGERIELQDPIGQTIHNFSYSDGWRANTDGDGYSLTIIDPTNSDPNSWDEKDSWRPSVYVNGSPDWDDSGILSNPGAIVINELLAHSDGYPNDWIELQNTTGGPIDISGWFISDNDSNLMKYQIQSPTIILGGQYVVLTQDDHFGNSGDPGTFDTFGLSEHGEQVCLSSGVDSNGVLTGYRQKEDFGASENGVSFGRYYKASTDNYNFVAMDSNTPGTTNAYPKVGPIVINEIMYHPDWPPRSPYDNDEYEYIELYNISGTDVNLYDEDSIPWKFTDGIEFEFPTDANIPAGGYALVVKDLDAFTWRYGAVGAQIFGPYDDKLSNSGEKLELSMPGDLDGDGVRHYIRIDRVNYGDGSEAHWPVPADGGGASLSRSVLSDYGNDPNNWTPEIPSPGTVNP